MKLNDYNYYIRFRKRIEDLTEDFGTIFSNMATRQDAPDWLSDYTASMLDLEFEGLYSGRWLNKLSAGLYSIVDGEIQKTGNISTVTEFLLQTYRTKWDKLFYLYSLTMGNDLDTADYNPIENYASYENTTYNNLTDKLTKTGKERSAQKSQIKQKPLKTTRSILDEYGEKDNQGNYKNGIKDTTAYNRNYTTTDTAGQTPAQGDPVPFTTNEETLIAGLDSDTYAKSENRIRKESGVRGSSAFTDTTGSGESTERTGKHSSLSVDGGKINSDGTVSEDLIQIVTELDPALNYSELSFSPFLEGEPPRADTNVKSGSFTITKNGNIGVMTASQMIESAWNGEMTRNFILQVLRDTADLLSLKCY